MLRNKKGQSTVEYAILIGVIVAAVVAMQTYIKRGLQARYHDGIQFLSTETSAVGSTTQYEPYYLISDYTTARDRTINENVQIRGGATRTLTSPEVTTRAVAGYEQFNDTSGAD